MNEIQNSEINFCSDCARKKLKNWNGWPHKTQPIPYLEPLSGEVCDICNSSKKLSNDRICWVNVHEEYNTGLPNYWQLKIDADPWYKKWGLPYKNIMKCPKCRTKAIISEMKHPNGRKELRCNCENCDAII